MSQRRATRSASTASSQDGDDDVQEIIPVRRTSSRLAAIRSSVEPELRPGPIPASSTPARATLAGSTARTTRASSVASNADVTTTEHSAPRPQRCASATDASETPIRRSTRIKDKTPDRTLAAPTPVRAARSVKKPSVPSIAEEKDGDEVQVLEVAPAKVELPEKTPAKAIATPKTGARNQRLCDNLVKSLFTPLPTAPDTRSQSQSLNDTVESMDWESCPTPKKTPAPTVAPVAEEDEDDCVFIDDDEVEESKKAASPKKSPVKETKARTRSPVKTVKTASPAKSASAVGAVEETVQSPVKLITPSSPAKLSPAKATELELVEEKVVSPKKSPVKARTPSPVKAASPKKAVVEDVHEDEPVVDSPKSAKKSKSKKAKVPEPESEEEMEEEDEDAVENGLETEKSGMLPDCVADFKHLLNDPSSVVCSLNAALPLLYSFSTRLQTRHDDLPKDFMSLDAETMWQQIAHRNRQITKEFRKLKLTMEDEVVLNGLVEIEEQEEESDEEEMDMFGGEDMDDEEEDEGSEQGGALDEDEEDEDEEEECDLFNLKAEDLKDLEKELEAMGEESDDGEGAAKKKGKKKTAMGEVPAAAEQKKEKKYRKSIVDDKFFSLAQMDEFLDEQDRNQANAPGLLETVDDSLGGSADYKYEDFFGSKAEIAAIDANMKKKSAELSRRKSVRFAMDEEDEGEEPEQQDEEGEEEGEDEMRQDADADDYEGAGDERVLLGPAEEDEGAQSHLKQSQNKLKETIKKLEAENVAAKGWEMVGEARASDRQHNTLLETHVQFEHGAKKAPEVTEDFTEKLEHLIKQRIKDKVFDDVVKKVRVEENAESYRAQAFEDMDMTKKSLVDVYEEQYNKAQGQVSTEAETPNEEHVEIEKRVNLLLARIDALAHYSYTPPEVRPEVKVVSNMSALRVEEVGAMASTDEQLLAPEETKKREKGEMKAKEERSKTDKLRERRKKKNRQRVMAEKGYGDVTKEMTGEDGEPRKKKKKKLGEKNESAGGKSDLKSSAFFHKLEETVREEIKQKKTKKDKVKKTVEGKSNKYVL